ncbi:MAG: hypothetical protein ACLTK0_01690 [Anaerovoracaceae bacterium]
MNHLTPTEIAQTMTQIGVSKSESSIRKLLVMGVMAGAYIAFAGAASTMGAFNLLFEADTYGLGKILCGAIHRRPGHGNSGRSRTFTGNCLITLSVIKKKPQQQKCSETGWSLHSKFRRQRPGRLARI